MSQRRLTQRVDLGDAHQLVLEVRPAHDPSQAWGYTGVVISVEDQSGSVWLWYRDNDRWLYVSCWGTGELKQSADPWRQLAVGGGGGRTGTAGGRPRQARAAPATPTSVTGSRS